MERLQRRLPHIALSTSLFRNCRVLFLLSALLAAGCSDNGKQVAAPTPMANSGSAKPKIDIPQGTGFDFYVLSLSWSPHYCASKSGDADLQQCRSGKPFGFIVHGLWPQNERGYPEFCAANNGPSRDEIRSVADLTPSAGLVRHEWEKHGACSGLSPSDYFNAMRAARQMVAIPPQFTNASRTILLSTSQVENAFVQANPGLGNQSVAVDCDRQKLAEVRICFTKSMQFRACEDVDRTGCRAQSITIEPIK